MVASVRSVGKAVAPPEGSEVPVDTEIGSRADAVGSGRRSPLLGAVAGVIATLAFTVLHDLWISDIWATLAPMLIAGALSGLCLAWSYSTVPGRESAARWLGYNTFHVVLLLALGGVSLAVLDPILSMADLMASPDPLGDVLPRALPLMAAASVVGTVLVWLTYGRSRRSLAPMLLTQLLLVFFIGHNLAILGLVDIPADERIRLVSFVGVTVFLGASFALIAEGLERVRRRLIG
jgi:hypothetical protein